MWMSENETNIKEISGETGLTIQQVHTSIKFLKNMGMIKTKTTWKLEKGIPRSKKLIEINPTMEKVIRRVVKDV